MQYLEERNLSPPVMQMPIIIAPLNFRRPKKKKSGDNHVRQSLKEAQHVGGVENSKSCHPYCFIT